MKFSTILDTSKRNAFVLHYNLVTNIIYYKDLTLSRELIMWDNEKSVWCPWILNNVEEINFSFENARFWTLIKEMDLRS